MTRLFLATINTEKFVQRLKIALILLAVALGVFSKSHANVTVWPQAIENAVIKAVEKDQKPATLTTDTKWLIECFNLPTLPIELTGDKLSISVVSNDPQLVSTRRVMTVTLKTSTQKQELSIPVKIAVEKPVWIVTQLIDAKQPLNAKYLKQEVKQLPDLGAYTLPTNINLSDYITRLNLQPGAIVDTRQVATQPVVVQNADVNLILRLGNDCEVQTRAIALENGAIGEHILVKRQMPNKMFIRQKAVVIRKNTVSIEL